MAIQLEKEQKRANWKSIIIVGAVVIVLVGGAYFLFFAPTPGIEALVPSEQRVTARISRLQLNTQPAIEVFSSGRLKILVAPPVTGQTGRANPFVRF